MQKNRFLRQIRSRPRLLISILVAVVVALFLPRAIADELVTRALIAWNVGTGLFIVLAAIMMVRCPLETIQRRAKLEDEGQHVVLILVVVAVIASLAAIAGELGVVKDMRGWARSAHVALAGATVFTSWAFMHLIFALHYAHDFYGEVARGRDPGLAFPGKERPDYLDFFYFAAIIGTSAQTADVSLTTSALRRMGSLHCILSFFFNTTILALTINIAASML